ncbi:Putative ribonuclease H protein At1g65750 [Linum perenne]
MSWMRWSKLCVKKRDGGIGFKNLHAFNLAMVGKQGWKLMKDQDALVTKIFKAKYFPKVDFLSATLRSNPSFVWHGILKTQSLLQQGIRWRVGNGNGIRVWSDPWLKEEDRRYVISPVRQGLEDLRVSELWIPGTRSWDEELLEELFLPDDVEAILRITPSTEQEHDTMIWHVSQDGEYSVKTAYKEEMKREHSREPLSVQGPWKKLWEMNLPPKTLHFAWRVGRGILPLRQTLQGRHLSVPIECGLCNEDLESEIHLFGRCIVARDCWRIAGLWDRVESLLDRFTAFKDLIGEVISTWDADSMERWITVIWSLWYERNQRVWQRESRPASVIVEAGMTTIAEWKAARRKHDTHTTRSDQVSAICPRWHPPSPDCLKCNVDASFRQRDRKWGWGAVLRNHTGEVVAFRTGWEVGLPEVKEGEAKSLLEALRWAAGQLPRKIIFETDCQLVSEALRRSETAVTEFGVIIEECRKVLQLNPDFSVCFVRRNRNVVAHELAQRSFTLASPFTGHVPPIWLEDALSLTCTRDDH